MPEPTSSALDTVRNLLTEEEKKKIVDFWNSRKEDPPSFRQILEHVFGEAVDARSKIAVAVKKFIAEKSVSTNSPVGSGTLSTPAELSPEHKQFILNNHKSLDLVEMAQIIFNDPSITFRDKEVRLVSKEAKLHDSNAQNDIPDDEYRPPNTVQRALARVRIYTNRDLKEEEISPAQKKGIESLIKYLANFRFVSQISIYVTRTERDLFEANFIRFTYDKWDLNEEEIEQYILLCTDAVTLHNIQRHIRKLEQLLDDVTDDPDGRISMGLTESITSARKEYNECFSRQDKLLKNLVVKRSDRIAKQGNRRESFADLIEFFQEEKKRKLFVELIGERKKMIKTEIGRLRDMSELKVQIYGLNEEELLEG